MALRKLVAALLALALLGTAALSEGGGLVIEWGDGEEAMVESPLPEFADPDMGDAVESAISVDEPASDDAVESAISESDPASSEDVESAVFADAAPVEAEIPDGQTADGDQSYVVNLEQRLPLAGVKIGIDPGHQAHANSARETIAPNSTQTKAKVLGGATGVSTGIPEYITVLEIAFKLREALESQGAEVYMTRESHDVDISNQERARMMNDLGVDLVLRIHCDGAEDHSRHGIALYCSRSNAIAGESCRAAEAILPRMVEATGAPGNGIVQNDNYTGQNWSTVPCIMVECGFLSNPEEDARLNDEDYQWLLAAGMTNGIIDYIEQRNGIQ